jgi:hypothetical protein
VRLLQLGLLQTQNVEPVRFFAQLAEKGWIFLNRRAQTVDVPTEHAQKLLLLLLRIGIGI